MALAESTLTVYCNVEYERKYHQYHQYHRNLEAKKSIAFQAKKEYSSVSLVRYHHQGYLRLLLPKPYLQPKWSYLTLLIYAQDFVKSFNYICLGVKEITITLLEIIIVRVKQYTGFPEGRVVSQKHIFKRTTGGFVRQVRLLWAPVRANKLLIPA